MAEITPEKLNEEVSKQIEETFSGLFKAVIPNVTDKLQKQVDAFQKSLSTGTGKRIDKSLESLNKFLETFDVRIDDLGAEFSKAEEIRNKLNADKNKLEEEAIKLREKNIFTETEIVRNRKTGEVETKLRLLTEKQINAKKDKIIADEKKLLVDEQKNLEKIRQFQQGDIKLTKRQEESLLTENQNIQERKILLDEEKKLFTGRSGRFDKRIGGFLDDFENALNDRAPDFLIPVIQPLLDGARQIQKTVTLIVDGFSFVTKGLKKLLPSFEGMFEGVNKIFGKGFTAITKGFKGFDKGLKGVFNAVSKGFKSFGGRIFKASASLLTFTKRIIAAGLAALVAFVPFIIPMLKIIGVIGLAITAFVLLRKGFSLFTEKVLPYIREKLANFGLVIKKIGAFVKEKLTAFAEGVMELPGKIANFFNKVFVKIQNFFIDAINAVIALINKIKIGDDIEFIKRVEEKELPADVAGDAKIEVSDKEQKELQDAEDQKELDSILGKDEEKPKVLAEEEKKFDKLLENFNQKKENMIFDLPKEGFNIDPEDLIKEEKKEPMTFAQNNSPINNVNQINNSSIQANLARNSDDTFYILNKQSA